MRPPCELRDGVKVVDRLRQQPADVHGIGGRQPHLSAQLCVAERLAREPVTVVEAARHGVRAHVRPLAVEHRQLRFLRRADAAVRIEDHDARVRHAVKGVRHRAAGVAGRRDQHREGVVREMKGRHHARHHTRADVLERQRRPMKQLEREDAGLDLDEGDLEVERFDDNRFEHGGVEFAAGERAERA